MDLILNAAATASSTLNQHWAKHWLKIDQKRILANKNNRLHIDQRDKDTESVIDTIWRTKV